MNVYKFTHIIKLCTCTCVECIVGLHCSYFSSYTYSRLIIILNFHADAYKVE